MGFFDRAKKIVGGAKDMLTAPFEVVVDLTQGALTDKDFDVLGTLKDEAGEFFEGFAEANYVQSKALGAAKRNLLDPALEATETLYREGFAEPITTAMTVASLSQADEEGAGGFAGFFKGDLWREAYNIAQDRSPGQAIMLAIGTDDVRDETQVEKTEDSLWFGVGSGVADAVLRLNPAEPTNAIAGVFMGARQGLRAVGNIDDALNTNRLASFLERVDTIKANKGEGAAAAIRHELFPNHEQGAYISTLLADTANRDEAVSVMRSLMGDSQALAKLKETRVDIAHQVQNLVDDTADLWGKGAPPAELTAQMERLYQADDRLAVAEEAFGTVRELPRYGRAREAMAQASSSTFYQKSPLTRPLKVTTNRASHHWLNLNDQRSDVQVWRQLQRSRLPQEAQEAARTKYMAAVSPAQRQQVAVEIEDQITRATLEHFGVTSKDVDAILAHATADRASAMGALRGRRYDAQGRGVVEYEGADGVMEAVHLPLHVTQEANLLPMVDIPTLERAAAAASGRSIGKYHKFRMENPVTDIPENVLNLFYSAWRPATLLRGAWPMRVVMDEQLRIISDIGATTIAKFYPKGTSELFDRTFSFVGRHSPLRRLDEDAFTREAVENRAIARHNQPVVVALTDEQRAAYRSAADELDAQLLDEIQPNALVHAGDRNNFGRVVSVSGDTAQVHFVNRAQGTSATVSLPKSQLSIPGRPSGGGQLVDEGLAFPSGFGAPGDDANIFTQTAGSQGTFRQMVQDEQVRWQQAMRQHSGEWTTIQPDMKDHAGAWEWAVNKHIRQAEAPRKVLEGMGADELAEWFIKTKEGRAYAREMRWKPDSLQGHAEDIVEQVHAYVPEALRGEGALRDLSYDELVEAIPNVMARPSVHGEILTQATGTSELAKMARRAVDAGFSAMGKAPTDALSRHPYFNFHYEQEVTRLASQLDTIGPDDVDRIARQARKFAENRTQDLLYDLAERSELSELGRLWAPFLAATQEVAVTWMRRTAANPRFVNRMRVAWGAPEAAGMVHDENGNTVQSEGGAVNPLTGERVEAGNERYVTLPTALSGLVTDRVVAVNKKSINLVLSGGIGFGPPVQVAVNELVKDRPDLAESVKFILPFGTTANSVDLLLPTQARRFKEGSQEDDNRTYFNMKMRLYFDALVDYNLGRREDKPTYEEVSEKTRSLWNIRQIASNLAPAAPIFESPYEPYIDTFRQAQQRVRDDKDAVGGKSKLLADEDGNPRSAEEWFVDEFGEEFFPLTVSLSTSKDGVPPTVAGFQAREKYKDLIEEYPELGGLIIGSEGAGEFARSVYDYQLSHETRPGSGIDQRETPTFEEAAAKPNVGQGWLAYGRAMDALDAVLHSRGLANYQVKAAADLAALKRLKIQELSEKYPEWHREFSVVDRDAFNRRIDGMKTLVADKRLQARPDIDGLEEYLKKRDALLTVLEGRKATTLTSQSNQDLRLLWETTVTDLLERNLAFSALYYRYLENDPMKGES